MNLKQASICGNNQVYIYDSIHFGDPHLYFHNDQLSKAQADIQRTYDFNGAYRRVAERYLNALSE